MKKYSKIQTIFKRDMSNKGALIAGSYSQPEFEYLYDNEWEYTEKIDGTNIRVMWDGANLKFGGRTDNAQIPVFLYDELNRMFSKEKFSEIFGSDPVTLYGEGYGKKIQKRGSSYISDGVSFVLFDVLIADWWLKRDDVLDVGCKLSIGAVPVIGRGTLGAAVNLAEMGFDSVWGEFEAEGLVLRPTTELRTRAGHRIITKIKCSDFK
jgi:hypothetical protein